MDWTAGLSWLSTLKSGRDEHDPGADHGDMGTAFGLDASLSAIEFGGASVPADHVREPWERRIVRRSEL